GNDSSRRLGTGRQAARPDSLPASHYMQLPCMGASDVYFEAGRRGQMDSVLVIEDSRAMQRTLQRLFESDALQVQIASDGVAGLEIFQKQPPSVVVLDLKLPRLSGKELCRTFKTQMPSVPIVVLSANYEVEDKVLLLELGADDYVTKPFSPKELLARVRRAMRRSSGAHPQSTSGAVVPVRDAVRHE